MNKVELENLWDWIVVNTDKEMSGAIKKFIKGQAEELEIAHLKELKLQLAEQKKDILMKEHNDRYNQEEKIRKDIIKEIDILIAQEIVIAHKEGQPTSRLTSLSVKVSKV